MTEPASVSRSESAKSTHQPNADTADPPGTAGRRWLFPIVWLVLALLWVVIIRIPLIANARQHLDSDLSVDGIVLREFTNGHWRLHYPATPGIGTLPVFYSLPQALIWGANPYTLVSGGTVAYLGLVLATVGLAWSAFGRDTALWSLVPLTFCSTGALWLSARITGGHLSAALFHALAFWVFHRVITRGTRRDTLIFGLICGFGLYVDTMFLLTLAGLAPAALIFWWRTGRSLGAAHSTLLFTVAFLVGFLPRAIGAKTDPFNAYPQEFIRQFESGLLLEHLKLLGLECFPRLIFGHRLPDLQADPAAIGLGGPAPILFQHERNPVAIAVTVVLATILMASIRALASPEASERDRASDSIRWGLLVSSVITLVAFIIFRDIFNSDNYRYLVNLLVPWAIGCGLFLRSIAKVGRVGCVAASLCAGLVAVLMTVDTARWYRQFGWLDESYRPVQVAVEDPLLDWFNAHPEIHSCYGGYWDVYKLSFLAKHELIGIPFPIYPNRFPEWLLKLPSGHTDVVIRRRHQMTGRFSEHARRNGGQVIAEESTFEILTWPPKRDEP